MLNTFWNRIASPYRSQAPQGPVAPPARPPQPVALTQFPLFRETLVGRLTGVRGGVPAAGVALTAGADGASPMEQLNRLAARYGIPPSSNQRTWQKAIVRALVIDEARRQGVDPRLALAVAIHESGLIMWREPERGTVSTNINRRGETYHSTDHGVMQINDRAHRRAFPAAANDVEANVRYGMGMLARISRSSAAKDLGLGLGTWDGILSVYGIGHLPRTERDWEIRRQRTPGYQRILAEMGPI